MYDGITWYRHSFKKVQFCLHVLYHGKVRGGNRSAYDAFNVVIHDGIDCVMKTMTSRTRHLAVESGSTISRLRRGAGARHPVSKRHLESNASNLGCVDTQKGCEHFNLAGITAVLFDTGCKYYLAFSNHSRLLAKCSISVYRATES